MDPGQARRVTQKHPCTGPTFTSNGKLGWARTTKTRRPPLLRFHSFDLNIQHQHPHPHSHPLTAPPALQLLPSSPASRSTGPTSPRLPYLLSRYNINTSAIAPSVRRGPEILLELVYDSRFRLSLAQIRVPEYDVPLLLHRQRHVARYDAAFVNASYVPIPSSSV